MLVSGREGDAMPNMTRLAVERAGRRLGREVIVRCRMLQEPRRLPDFLIIGTQRGGTTSLYRYLSQHPQVCPPLGKELQYFTVNWHRSCRWYRAHFPRVAADDGVERELCQTFEASPYYLFHPHAPARAAEVVPQARLIALLRDPVERAYSHYLHNVRFGYEPLSFEAAIDAEEERIGEETRRLCEGTCHVSRDHQHFSYVARGRYAPQVRRWQEHYPGRLLVLTSEDLYQRPGDTFSTLLRFLELKQWQPPSFPQHTRRTLADSRMKPETRTKLAEIFDAPNRELRELIGQDLSGWTYARS